MLPSIPVPTLRILKVDDYEPVLVEPSLFLFYFLANLFLFNLILMLNLSFLFIEEAHF
jgi:hypothetical protein